MENEVTGNILLPCTECTKGCFRIHGNHKFKDKENSDGYSYFFKIMLGDFAQKLPIPPAFVPKLGSETGNRISQNVVLQGPRSSRGSRSPRLVAKLWSTNGGLEFRQGWEKFVHQYRIELGDFLVFKYIGWSYFKVKIFGRSGCEKNLTILPERKSQKICPSPSSALLGNFEKNMSDKSQISLVSDKERSERRETVLALGDPGKEPSSSSSSHRRGCPPKNPQHCNSFISRKKQQRKISRD
ncbi:B3 domain-containing protein Os01g0905400 [Cryptomeria japonica]|uniref:B3 domain-containing protein Os01g0905400 n=1 Tax=Cryptomeria japonica TaxID=3369 RepID=UPI0025ACF39E|nr:B3 domain-containing protein Os01g0905400 [Cryptomeria japonica]